MVGLLYIVFLLFCYKLQKYICLGENLIKKIDYPISFFNIIDCWVYIY